MEKVYTIEEFSEELKQTVQTTRNWIKLNQIKYAKKIIGINKFRYEIPESELLRIQQLMRG
jgi:hypothetical protein